MKPFYSFCNFCIFLLFVVIILITTHTINIEKYTLLRNVGSFPKHQLLIKKHNKLKTESNKNQSKKYTGHRYDRYHTRNNPHTKNYIINQ